MSPVAPSESGASARATQAPDRLRITEIFRSIQGESCFAGLPTVFVRLTGCPLRCTYCDTAYAFHGGGWQTLDAIQDRVEVLGAGHVCITGGEPLAQKRVHALMTRLCDGGYVVSLETAGAHDVSRVDRRVVKIMDLKTPGSGEVARNRLDNLAALNPQDEIKFVICDRADFDWATDLIDRHGLAGKHALLMSPSFGQVPEADLAEWVLASGLPLRLNLQLHKYVWGEEPGR